MRSFDKQEQGYERDDGGRSLECAPIRVVRLPGSAVARLQPFQTCCSRRVDALFELADALLCARAPVASLPHLSLEPVVSLFIPATSLGVMTSRHLKSHDDLHP
jgi:hypothetical protein